MAATSISIQISRWRIAASTVRNLKWTLVKVVVVVVEGGIKGEERSEVVTRILLCYTARTKVLKFRENLIVTG